MSRETGFGMVDIPQAGEHRSTVIWMHGLGADGHDFTPILPMLGLPASLGVRFRFPEAPVRPVTLNGGYPMRSWFDIDSLPAASAEELGRSVNEEQLADSVRWVRKLVEEEKKAGIPAARIILAGFSQGGAVAIAAAAAEDIGGDPVEVGGLLALSTYVPRPRAVMPPLLSESRLFSAHGISDEVIPHRNGEASYRALRTAGWEGVFRTYPIGHAVSAEEIRDIGRFLADLLRETE